MEQIQLAILLSGSHKCVGAARSVQPSLLTSVCNFYFSSSPSSSCSSPPPPPPPPLASPPALYARISPETTHARKRKVCWFGVCAFKLCILYKSFNGALLIRPFYPDSRPDFGIFLLAKWSRHFLYYHHRLTVQVRKVFKVLLQFQPFNYPYVIQVLDRYILLPCSLVRFKEPKIDLGQVSFLFPPSVLIRISLFETEDMASLISGEELNDQNNYSKFLAGPITTASGVTTRLPKHNDSIIYCLSKLVLLRWSQRKRTCEQFLKAES